MSREDQVVHEHPSYGSVQLNRHSGSAYLFNSAVMHHGFVSLSIHEAQAIEETRTGDTRLFPRKQVVEIWMTEAQFAEMVSRWNHGTGTACTIVRRPDPEAKLVGVDRPPPEKTGRDRLESVIEESVRGVKSDVTRMADEIEALVGDKLGKKGTDRLKIILQTLRENPPSNLKFAQEMLHESMEKMIARGKVEMEAAGRNLLHRLGLGKMAEEAIKSLPMPDFGKRDKEKAG
jgi:hypothetical protein